MPKTKLTLSDPMAKTLKVYTVQTKSSLHAQSQVAEEALREFFEKRDAKIGETWYFERVEPTEELIFMISPCCQP